MRRFLLTSALMILASPAMADMTAVPGGDEPLPPSVSESTFVPPEKCDITISFGSSGNGTDDDTGQAMMTYLDDEFMRLSYTRQSWGREGEYNYCITVTNADDGRSIYRQLKNLLPIEHTGKSPVMIKARHLKAAVIEPITDPVPPLPDDRL